MTLRVTLGIDPGMKGAIAVLADGEPACFLDMPTKPHPRKGNRIDAGRLIAMFRGLAQQHQGAHLFACLEEIAVRQTDQRGNAQRIGEGYGMLLASLAANGIAFAEVRPQTWKARFGFIRQPKDATRCAAIDRWPQIATSLRLKKHDGRADALYIARWAWETEAWV